MKRKKVDMSNCEEGDVLMANDGINLSPEVRVLHCLIMLLDVLKQQMLAKNDEAILLCSQHILRRGSAARVCLEPVTSSVTAKLMKQLNALVMACLFNNKGFLKYELLLDAVQVEDSKLVNEQLAVHTVLSTLCDVIAHDSIPVFQHILFQFYSGFLETSKNTRHHLVMLATIFHLVGVDVQGEITIDANSSALSFVDKIKIKSTRREAAINTLIEVLQNIKGKSKESCFETFFKSYLSQQKASKPKSHYSLRTIRLILQMYPLQFLDELPSFLGHLITWEKSSDEMYQEYEHLLIKVLNLFSTLQRLSTIVSLLIQSPVVSKDLLLRHEEFLPPFDFTEKMQNLRPLLPQK